MKRAIGVSRRLGMLVALATTAILAAVGITLFQSYEDANDAAARVAANTLMFMQREVVNTLTNFDVALAGLDEAYDYPAIQALPPAELEHLLQQRTRRGAQTGSLALTDAAGTVLFSATPDFPRGQNLSDRTLFIRQKEGAEGGLFISRPFRDAAGEIAVAVSRARKNGGGLFKGVAVGVLRLSTLNEMMAAAQLGSDGKISLYRTDGTVLARTPFPDARPDPALQPDPAQARPPTPDSLSRFFTQASGTFQAVGPVDGLDRRYVYANVPNLPLVVSVSLSMREIYESWSARAAYLAIVTGLSCVAIVTLTLLFRRELLQRARAELQLAELATVDSLTGIANRRRFDQRLAQEWRRASRTGQSIALIMIDVDHFKAFNDKHGHWLGDDLLIHIAGAISGALRRPGDMVARYGGEEFSVILPETNREGAQQIAERIRTAISLTGIEDATGRIVGTTASLGAAGKTPQPGEDVGDLVQQADAALYRAKKGGRNSVIMAGDPDRLQTVAEAS